MLHDLRSHLESLVANYGEARKPKNWQRPAHPAVHQALADYIAAGNYAYTEAVVRHIITTFELGDPSLRYDHQAIHDRGDQLAIVLSTEVYIASCERTRNENIAKRDALAAEGFTPITELEPVAGMRIQLADRPEVFRLVEAGRDWVLLAPRKRSNGLSLNALCAQHRQFQKSESDYDHNGGAVVRMFKVVK